MEKREKIFMAEETMNRAQVLRDFLKGRCSRKEAGCLLRVSERTISRLSNRWEKKGILGLEHALAGKASKRKTPQETIDRVQGLLRGKYFGFNLRHFHELLCRDEKFQLSYSTVKRIAHAIKLVRRKKRRASIRMRRQRFANAGYLLQMDGSHHRWFGSQRSCLVAAIDDATSEIVYGSFNKTETLDGYFEVLESIFKVRGIPRVLYVDRASWLSGTADDEKGQFFRACGELGIRIIYANSPEAKGRIERAWRTLQDRLCSEFRLRSIQTLEDATAYFNTIFIPQTWADKFVVKATNSRVMYRPVPKAKNLDEVFCRKYERLIRKDHTLLWDNEVYKITAKIHAPIQGYHAEIRVYHKGQFRAYLGSLDLDLQKMRAGCWKKDIPQVRELRLAFKNVPEDLREKHRL